MKILFTDPLHNEGIKLLKNANFEVIDGTNASIEKKISLSSNVDAWLIRSGTTINKKAIDQAQELKIIGRAGVGVDNIDIEYATKRGIVVTNTPDVNTTSACEHTIALMLTLSRNISLGDQSIKIGNWNRNELIGTEISSKTMGIVGMGKIGRELMKRCLSFDMKILAYDPYVSKTLIERKNVDLVSLDELFSNSDFISTHVPLNDNTRDLINKESFSLMKSNVRIINVARGGIINEQDLAEALKKNKIAGAAIDVFSKEPIETNNPLINAPNVILTPHLGASTEEAKKGVSTAICKQVIDYLLNDNISNALNFPITNFEKFNEIKYFLKLSEKLGVIQSQLSSKAIKSIIIELYGNIKESKTIMLAFVKGILSHRNPDRVNYINAEALLKENNINVTYSLSNENISYENMIKTIVKSDDDEVKICGSLFQGNRPRLVNLFGYELDIVPNGIMFFIKNIDKPGVIGKIGTILGDSKINIEEFLLSKKKSNELAFSVVRLDSIPSQQIIDQINSLDEVQSIQLLNC